MYWLFYILEILRNTSYKYNILWFTNYYVCMYVCVCVCVCVCDACSIIYSISNWGRK